MGLIQAGAATAVALQGTEQFHSHPEAPPTPFRPAAAVAADREDRGPMNLGRGVLAVGAVPPEAAP